MENKKVAIVLSCFGSAIDLQSYEAFRAHMGENFQTIPIFIAYTSNIVIKKLRSAGLAANVKHLKQVLSEVESAGFQHIIVSSVYLFPTEEHERVKETVDAFAHLTSSKAKYYVTDSILNAVEDLHAFVSDICHPEHQQEAQLFITHGFFRLDLRGASSYFYLKDILERLSPNNIFASLEGPYAYSLQKEFIINSCRIRNLLEVKIVPLLLVSGHHLVSDIREIATELEAEGLKVKIVEKNLLSMPIVLAILKAQLEKHLEDIQ
ncbi:MAG: sirohydrochlorin cobaltochelatase [Oligoflexia bacterium]|nr:sirohydrochlorin cobaltochelatase [Oligoflexia bacterium]MBF0365920.1 sirohydrochlorin cobaltochelatase [Oligoflexia bacterium]